MNKFITNLVSIFLFCMLIAFGLTLLGAALYLGIFIFIIFAIAIGVLYAKDWLLYKWYQKHPETRKSDNIIERAFENFIAIQYAWSEFKYKKLRELCTDELYNSYKSQIETLK